MPVMRSNGLQPRDIGVHFGKHRDNFVNIGNDNKNFVYVCMTSGKHRVHSDVFRKTPEVFQLNSDLFRLLMEFAEFI